MATLKRERKVQEGSMIFDAYFEGTYQKNITVGKGWAATQTAKDCFKVGEKEYAVTGYDHYNGHFSGFTDRGAIFGIFVAEVVE